ncbi:reverse transcriptase [Plasmopara halstedii]|uniref:Reverse transcriptase n=1 Tax=Plasmopara halstedii TaxID=4781 RepID=A0A0P1AXX3_PLAHL|nr:reverse transcriptase [Plasmopara halstedii]CEG46061.1 reverse transcriptase [Plasmopara halstedii]|eukprot:XP_024582430.1 reverse transcriptase [Plasmopara halstedii]
MTGLEDGDVALEAISAVDALIELDSMSFEEFGGALKAGNLAEVVIIRPNEEIYSSSLLIEAVVVDTKRLLNARMGPSILMDHSDPYYPLIKEFEDVVSKDPPSALLQTEVRHETDLVTGTQYCVTRQ